ncbi:MAG: transcription termination/antitermination protein NusA [Candidatus Kerfeldbacteria bacterium]|nr:transcription termination/antitermination protein NusA [Candidatus Kerfeldbacteria bacterium]
MQQNSPILMAIQQICEEKNIPVSAVVETIEQALAAAYRKDFGQKNENIKVEFDPVTGGSRVFDVKLVVEGPAEGEETINEKKELLLADAKLLKPAVKIGDEIKTELKVPADYGRMAAQTAKQVIIQRLREAEREVVFSEYKDKEGQVVIGTIQRVEGRTVFVDLGHTIAVMPYSEQIVREHYAASARFKFYLVSVNATARGPEVIVSRTHPEIVRQLFEQEVPEIASGVVVIKAISREAGSRTKIAVYTEEANVDPIGSCVGQRGMRVQTVITQLGGEKIDIIEWSDDMRKFIAAALAPAKVQSVNLDEAQRLAQVEVAEDQLSLAIGRNGQNVRLAVKLTGWRIDISGSVSGHINIEEVDQEAAVVKNETETVSSAAGDLAAPAAPSDKTETDTPTPVN